MIVGIDNGIDGGLCAVSAHNGMIISYTAMPTYERKGKREIDTVAVKNWIAELHTEPQIFIEEPLRHAKSSQAVRSMAISFGKLYGLCETKGWRVHDIEVTEWQKKMLPGVQRGQTKTVALKVASHLAPHCPFLKSEKSKVPHDGIVDAYLIAIYAFRHGDIELF
jgi:hypothetical protein